MSKEASEQKQVKGAIKEGFIQVNGVFSCSKRWLVLDTSTLSIFKRKGSKKPIKKIDLSLEPKVDIWDSKNLIYIRYKSSNNSSSTHSSSLTCPNAMETDEWAKELEIILKHYRKVL